MSPSEAAWERYHRLGLRTDDPIAMMNAVLDMMAQEHVFREKVRAFVTSDPDTAAHVMTFHEMVVALGESCT